MIHRVFSRGFLSIVVICLLTAVPIIANAQLEEWGAQADTSTALCPTYCTDYEFGPFDGGFQEFSGTSSFTDLRGSADAEASLTGSLFSPVLRARGGGAGVPQAGGAFAEAFAVQGYTYEGEETKTFTLDITLSGTIIPSDPAVSSLNSTVALFETDDFEYNPFFGDLLENGATLYQQTGGGGNASVQFYKNEYGYFSETQSISVELDPGDSFYLWSKLNASGVGHGGLGGTADAYNTLTMAFTDGDGLVADGVLVPEPVSSTLFIVGGAALGFRRWRKRGKA